MKKAHVPQCSLQHYLARTEKQPRCPSSDEWIKKIWCLYTMKYYSAIKWKTLESILMRWMNLESIIQNEVGQREKNRFCMLTNVYGI